MDTRQRWESSEKIDVRNKFPLISYEELEEERYLDVYEKICVSIFKKSLTVDEAKKQLSGTDLKNNHTKFIFNLKGFLMELSSIESLYLILEDENQKEEIITLKLIREKKINSIIEKAKENDLKIIAYKTGFIFELVFDLSFILHVVKGSDLETIKDLIKKNGLFVL